MFSVILMQYKESHIIIKEYDIILEKSFIVIRDEIHINFKWYDGKKKFNWNWENKEYRLKYSDEMLERLKNKNGYEYIEPVKNPQMPSGEYKHTPQQGRDHSFDNDRFSDYWGLSRKACKGYF